MLEAELANEQRTPSLFGDDPTTPDLDAIALEIETWEREGMRFLTLLDPGYPENLTLGSRPPAIRFPRGQSRSAGCTRRRGRRHPHSV